MPLYEFRCAACGIEFEELVTRRDESVPCPSCGAEGAQRLMSRFAFKADAGGRMKTSVGGSCSSCKPGPSGCSGCSH